MKKQLKIVVLAKQVPDTRNVGKDAMTPEGTVNRAALPAIFNPEDLNALEAALFLKDETEGSTVHILTMGPPRAADIIRDAIFRGADGGYLLTDRKFAGSDTLATSYALSCALRKIPPAVSVAGRQAIDGDTAQVGPQVAEKLGLPQVTYLEGIKYEGGNRLVVKKWTEEGYQLLEVETPCVVTVLSSANQPRYMSVRGIVEAYDKQVEVWGFDNISVEESKLGLAGSPTRVFKSFTKGAKSAGKVFDLEPAEAADLIVEKLKEKFII